MDSESISEFISSKLIEMMKKRLLIMHKSSYAQQNLVAVHMRDVS